MKIIIDTQIVLDGITPLKGIISNKTLIPILECVKIESYDGDLYFTGDNNEVNCVIADVPDQMIENFSFCVQHSLFLAILSSLKRQDLSVDIRDGEIFVNHSKGDFKLPTFPVSEFPRPKTEKMLGKAKTRGESFKNSINIANKFILNSEMEPMANISIIVDKSITIRSTNRATLFKEILKGKGDGTEILISGKSSTLLSSLLNDKKVKMTYSDNLFRVSNGAVTVTIVKQEGVFPVKMFDQIADNKDGLSRLEINSDSLVNSLRRLSSIMDEKTNKIIFNFSKSSLNIVCDNKNKATNAHEDITSKFTDKRSVGYNLKFLVEILSVMTGDVKFYVSEANLLYLFSDNKVGIVAQMQID